MYAVLSDIHGNVEALIAVLADLGERRVQEIYCLGDTIGYGPNPVECVRLSMGWTMVLRGSFEEAMLSNDDLGGWSATAAKKSVLWCRSLQGDSQDARSLAGFLAQQPILNRTGTVTYVHGSPHSPLYEYLFPEDTYNPRKMQRQADQFEQLCFCGHSHVPGIFVEESPGNWKFFSPAEIDSVWKVNGRKTICNVGAVGQPRDGDWRTCYVLVDGAEIRFRRLNYDVATTIRKIHEAPDLDDFLGDRLREGR